MSGPWLAGPVRLHGPAGPWPPVLRTAATHRGVLVYGRLADWTHDPPDGPALPALLGQDRDRHDSLTRPGARTGFAASRRFVKCLAGHLLHAPPHTVELGYGPGGRPYLRGCTELDISLSHTADLLVAGISAHGTIGVDAELTARPMRLDGMESRFWTPYESAALARTPERERPARSVRLWTLKEAYTKAIGQGIRYRFSDFGFDPHAPEPQLLRPDGTPGTGREWRFGVCRIEGRCTVGWALRRDSWEGGLSGHPE